MFELVGLLSVVLYAAIVLLGLALIIISVERRIAHRTCPVCDYDLRGHPRNAQQCPECGAEIVRMRAIQRRTVVSVRLAVLGFLLILSAGGIVILLAFISWW